MLECGLSFGLKGNDDETHEDVDHEECYDDDVDKVENGNIWTVVMLRTNIRCIGVNGDVENPENLLITEGKSWVVWSHPGQPSKVEATKSVSIPRMTLS